MFGGPTLGGYNSHTVAPIFYYNHFSKRETSNLLDQIYASACLLCFQTSCGHLKPFKMGLEVFVPKTRPKISSNFIDTYDMAMKLYWLIDMTKMNTHLLNYDILRMYD